MWHGDPLQEIFKRLDTAESGLTSRQAAQRRASDGPNIISGPKSKPMIVRFFAQFNDFMILILLTAAAVSAVVSIINGERDFLDPAIILAIVTVNALLGLIQEYKAERSLQALQKLTMPETVVLRDKKPVRISTDGLVPGDVILLETGDYVPADARLISSSNLRIEESMLTGESLPAEKNESSRYSNDTPIGDRKNMVFSGTSVVYGNGKALVVSTGMNTEMGRIAHMIMSQDSPQTPLQRRLEKTGRFLGIGALAICVAIFVLGILRNISPFTMFMTSVSLAVAAIPEGLPAIVTIMLAIGVQRMAKSNAIIRKLPAVETLGSATVICSDKTGTLTQNKMKVVEVCDIQGALSSKESNRRKILTLSALCSNATSDIGDPTEIALVQALEMLKTPLAHLRTGYPRIGELPFDSNRKRMSVVVGGGLKDSSRPYTVITKGAVDMLLDCCGYYEENGAIIAITPEIKKRFAAQNAEMAGKALRVLGIAYRILPERPAKIEALEKHLVLLGLVGMIDPPRPEVAEAVATCKEAGIRPIMITGDHILTAKAIARQTGILQEGSGAVTGKQLSEMPKGALLENIHKYSVFARVSPDHKVQIVQALQKKGEIVAMTGDGVNDAPALKAADIGCAMGQSGTDVAKGAADMILTDDNFATIVKAVKEGRGIYNNIRKAVHFLLSSNIGEIVTIFTAIFLGWHTPLLAIHLLWVNLVTDSLPAIALGLDPADENVMTQAPYNSQKSMFADGLWIRIALEGLMIGLLSLIAFGIGMVYFDEPGSSVIARTMCFMTLSIAQLFHAFNLRCENSIFSINPLGNQWLVGAFFTGILLQVGVATIPTLAAIFRVSALDLTQWGIVFALSFMPILLVEAQKWWNYRPTVLASLHS
ncbi:MAG: calcium-translocating P-type ATPase, PMCA-type [Defluviitaleaceae bacterium]|nr:calcium-translocating P-type ATPase, PMCA-type [Defluviitaleaceae bacterium]